MIIHENSAIPEFDATMEHFVQGLYIMHYFFVEFAI